LQRIKHLQWLQTVLGTGLCALGAAVCLGLIPLHQIG